MMDSKQQIFVTGASGFIAKHLTAALLNNGFNLKLHSQSGNIPRPSIFPECKVLYGKLSDFDSILDGLTGCTTLCHFAGPLSVDSSAKDAKELINDEHVNVTNLVRASRYAGVKQIIFASSSSIYNKPGMKKFASETDIVNPTSWLGKLKLNSENIIIDEASSAGINFNIFRIFNAYGEGLNRHMFIQRCIERALKNQSIEVFGGGKQSRDFIYIDDIVEIITTTILAPRRNFICNLGSGQLTTVYDVASKIVEITKSFSKINPTPMNKMRRELEVKELAANTTRMSSLFPDTKLTDIDEGLTKCLMANQTQPR